MRFAPATDNPQETKMKSLPRTLSVIPSIDSLSLAAMCAVLLCASALESRVKADPIPILNPSFEDITGAPNSTHFDEAGNLRDGHYSGQFGRPDDIVAFPSGNPVPGWLVTSGGTWNATNDRIIPPATHGNNRVYLNVNVNPGFYKQDVALSQTLTSTLTPGRYTLKLSVGRDPAYGYPGYRIQLRAGGAVIAEDDNSELPPAGGWVDSTITVDVRPDHPMLGRPLEIRLAVASSDGTDKEVNFDNVRLDGPPTPPRVIANSVSEFSAVQGVNNWFYGYYNLSNDLVSGYDPTQDFTELPRSERPSVHQIWNIGETFYTQVGANLMMPNSGTDNAGRTLREHWAIRRWVSDVTGPVSISGLLAKLGAGFDGVIASILVNGRSIYERTVAGTDAVGVQYKVGVKVEEGDLVDFVVKARNTVHSDETLFTAIIEPADQAPVVVAQPQAMSSCPGQNAVFTVEAAGAEPLSYQWYFNGNPITGQTGASLVLSNIQPTRAGSYSVVVSNVAGNVTSDVARLQVFPACVDLQMYAGLNVTGEIGKTYVIRYTLDPGSTDFSTWTPIATNRLSSPTWFFLDFDSPSTPKRFYGVALQP